MPQIIWSDTFRTKSDIQTRSKVFSTTSRLSRRIQYLPRSYWTDPKTIALHDDPHTSGTCAEVYRGIQKGEPVAVKVLRTSIQEDPDELKKVSTGGRRSTWTRADSTQNSAFVGR